MSQDNNDKNMLNITFVNQQKPDENDEVLVLLIDELLRLDNDLMKLDQQVHGLIAKTMQDTKLFAGKFGQVRYITTTNKDGHIKVILLVGTGDEVKLTEAAMEELGGKIFSAASLAKIPHVKVLLGDKIGHFVQKDAAALIASGALLASYRFDKYFTKQKEENKPVIKNLEIIADNPEEAEVLFIEKKALAIGVFSARNFVSEPPNHLYPESYAEQIIMLLEPLGVEIEVLGEREMRNLGMGALLGVGQGSQNESKLVVMKYQGLDDDSEPPVALVGKGVTFDTGGISLKPSAGMADMKYDMAGSAAVVGAIHSLALRGARANVVGVIGLVENMPGGNAQRPSDVVVTMSGQTAEVLDTDAEGRLVLADAIWYAQDKFNPKCVVDLATLTGAIVVALGNTYAGLFANNDDIANQLTKAGDNVNEKLWRMPLHKDFDDMIKSDIADVANLGNVRGAAGSSTAAHFIGRFVKEGMAWAHLDIAGMAWEKKGAAICPKGATGYGVRLLNRFVKDNYEQK